MSKTSATALAVSLLLFVMPQVSAGHHSGHPEPCPGDMPVVTWTYCMATESVFIYGRFVVSVFWNIVAAWNELYYSTVEPPLDQTCQFAIGKDCV